MENTNNPFPNNSLIKKFIRIPKSDLPVQNPINFTCKSGKVTYNLHSFEYPNSKSVPLKGILFFIPGYGEYCDFYTAYFSEFANQGYRVFCYDRKGFGKSEGYRGDFGKNVLDEHFSFIDQIVQKYPELEEVDKYVMGCSMGSLFAARII
jgi:acylglycerol lipase